MLRFPPGVLDAIIELLGQELPSSDP